MYICKHCGNDGCNGDCKQERRPLLKPIYTADLETDPFEYGKVPQPFVVGFYNGKDFRSFWGKDCIEQFFAFLETIEPGVIFFHNGGKFDFFYFVEKFSGKLMIVQGRILKAEVSKHEFRDSFAIMPFALAKYKKDKISYKIFVKGERNKKENKRKILHYLEGDCVYLYELCDAFVKRFGDKLTIGSTSMFELKQMHDFEALTERQDSELREKFYYGGRVQCFEAGIVKAKEIRVYDVNSMYPYVMRDFLHPISVPCGETKGIKRNTFFIEVTGKNYGAFPTRDKDGSIRFDIETGTFTVSIHEWKAAIHLGLFVPHKIQRCINFAHCSTFETFVNHFYNARKQAKDNGDVTHALFYKYILNSAYGKFAQNPENYFDYKITACNESLQDWEPAFVVDDSYIIWKQRVKRYVRHNVATAASITGAARSVLMEAIAKAKHPMYCDTDSIICEDLPGVKISSSELGAWKLEETGDRFAVAGKKLYALFQGRKCVKQASKGVKLKPVEIVKVAKGGTVVFDKESPSFKWDGTANFISRRVKMTI